jgi:hypothetical protein
MLSIAVPVLARLASTETNPPPPALTIMNGQVLVACTGNSNNQPNVAFQVTESESALIIEEVSLGQPVFSHGR